MAFANFYSSVETFFLVRDPLVREQTGHPKLAEGLELKVQVKQNHKGFKVIGSLNATFF